MTLTVVTLCLCLTATADEDRPCVVIVVGAPGASEYTTQFRRWADLWQSAAQKGSAQVVRIGLDAEGSVPDRERLRTTLAEKATGKEPLWLVLIGHGTFDGREAKFNLRGPDVSDADLAEWLKPVTRPVAVLDCSSGSSPFLSRLSAPNRVIATATKSGHELNFARFGQYLAESIGDPQADLDKDGQVSLLEAFLTASGRVNEFYRTQSRLATEHALLDDNGDRLGTPAEWFRGVRATRRAKDGAPLDGLRAHQFHLIPSDRERAMPADVRHKRDELEVAVAALRDQKVKLAADDYYARLEKLMLELGKLYRAVDAAPKATRDTKHEH
ncbi:MAG: hypothetical protein P4L84_17840 [Isosphaeraceae bacterium]|nr:hypothetical protein [Isosphaeraceae bacterium]